MFKFVLNFALHGLVGQTLGLLSMICYFVGLELVQNKSN